MAAIDDGLFFIVANDFHRNATTGGMKEVSAYNCYMHARHVAVHVN